MDTQVDKPPRPRAIRFGNRLFPPIGPARKRLLAVTEGISAGGAAFLGMSLMLYRPEFLTPESAVGLVTAVFGIGARLAVERIGRRRVSHIHPDNNLAAISPGDLDNAGRTLGQNLNISAEDIARAGKNKR